MKLHRAPDDRALHPFAGQWARIAAAALLTGLISCLPLRAGLAQTTANDVLIRGAITDDPGRGTALPNVITDADEAAIAAAIKANPNLGRVSFEARLIAEGPPIDRDVVWRIFQRSSPLSETPALIAELSSARPSIALKPGTYFVNAAHGRANLTRPITVLARGRSVEPFILNAGGLRASVTIAGDLAVPRTQAVAIDIFSDEADQSGERPRVVSGGRPGQVIRLNAGIYHIESRIGRGNAIVRAQVPVEAGKVTAVQIVHEAAIVAFKLVTTRGGEALAATRWTVLSNTGEVVLETVGAIPTHVLAPGQYIANAQSGGRRYRRDFTVSTGQNATVEIVAQ